MIKKLIAALVLSFQAISAVPYCDWCNSCWFTAEYLYWKIGESPRFHLEKGDHFHGRHLRQKWRSGARFASGFWFDECKRYGLEANYFILPERTRSNKSFCNRFDNDAFFREGFEERRGRLHLCNDLQGIEFNGIRNLYSSCQSDVIVLAGFRWWNFSDSFPFGLRRGPNFLRSIHVHDVKNNFYGGQIGAKFSYLFHRLYLNVVGKVALGSMFQSSKFQDFFFTEPFVENFCHHTRSNFSVLPECDLNVGYQITDCFRIQAGYTVMYATKVLHAANQIPRFSRREARTFRSDNLWVQGASAGVELRF